jgi:hypothetical protein
MPTIEVLVRRFIVVSSRPFEEIVRRLSDHRPFVIGLIAHTCVGATVRCPDLARSQYSESGSENPFDSVMYFLCQSSYSEVAEEVKEPAVSR